MEKATVTAKSVQKGHGPELAHHCVLGGIHDAQAIVSLLRNGVIKVAKARTYPN